MIFLACFVSVAFGQLPFQRKFSIQSQLYDEVSFKGGIDIPVQASVNDVSLTVDVLSISPSLETFSLCLTRIAAALGSPINWAQVCSAQLQFMNSTANGPRTWHTTSEYPVPAGTYFVSMAAVNAGNWTADITISGQYCGPGTFFNRKGCVTPETLAPGVTSTYSIVANTTTFVQIQASSQITAHTASMTLAGHASSAGVLACFTYTPGVLVQPGWCGGFGTTGALDVSVGTPAPRVWYLALMANGVAGGASANVSVNIVNCNATSYGGNCATPITALTEPGLITSFTSTPTSMPYFAYNASLAANGTSLAVAAATSVVFDNSTAQAPILLAKLGSLPNGYDYDLYGCNVWACGKHQQTLILPNNAVNAGAQETWYIAVVPPTVPPDSVVFVWDALDCPSGCSGVGTCDYDAAQCACTAVSVANAIDCQPLPDTSLPVTTVVLVLVGASLLAVACVVGSYGLEWWDKRKAKAGYQPI